MGGFQLWMALQAPSGSKGLIVCMMYVCMYVVVCMFTSSMKDLCAYSITQSRLTLCYPMDCSLPGFSVYGIF